MSTVKTKKRPEWATAIAVGLFIAGFGSLLSTVGGFVPEVAGIGTFLIGAGATVTLLGGSVYFLSRRG